MTHLGLVSAYRWPPACTLQSLDKIQHADWGLISFERQIEMSQDTMEIVNGDELEASRAQTKALQTKCATTPARPVNTHALAKRYTKEVSNGWLQGHEETRPDALLHLAMAITDHLHSVLNAASDAAQELECATDIDGVYNDWLVERINNIASNLGYSSRPSENTLREALKYASIQAESRRHCAQGYID